MALTYSILVQLIALALFAIGMSAFVTLVKGCFVLRRMARAGRRDFGPVILKSPLVPAVSTIAVPPDASAESLQFIRRLLDLHFGRNEVVVVLDGPTPEDLQIWKRELRLCSSTRGIDQKLPSAAVRGVYESTDPIRVVVIEKEAGGEHDAWNAGVNASTSPVIGLLDPASEFVPDVLLRLIQPMLEDYDSIIGVCGGVSAPPGEGSAAQFGALESLRTWLTRGAAFTGRNTILPFPGCALLVKRDSVLQAGGYTGNRMELFVRLHGLARFAKKPTRIAFLPDALSYRKAPATLPELQRQLQRDQAEIASAFKKRVALAGPFGWQVLRELFVGRRVRPLLEMLAYVMAVAGLVVGWIDVYTFLLVLLSTVGMGIVLSMAAVVLREVAEPASPDERRMAAMFFAALPENLWYRQLRNVWLIGSFRPLREGQKQNRGGKASSLPPAAVAASGK